MNRELQDLLNVVERKRSELNKMALSRKLTSKEVIESSRELDKLLNEVHLKIKNAAR